MARSRIGTFPDIPPKSYIQMSPAVTWRCLSPLPSRTGTAAAISLRTQGLSIRTCSGTVRAYRPAAASSSSLPSDLREIRQAQRSDGPATVLAIGKENPVNCIPQDEFVDWYFRVSNCDHLAKLKAKMKRICRNTGIENRYFHHDEEMLRDHPEFLDGRQPSIDARQEILASAVPELAAAAAAKAIAEWGRPAAVITHLVVSTYSGAHVPGVDLRVASLLGLRPTVQRTMLYLTACSAGSASLRVAKDMAENTRGARVLVVCADLSLIFFRGPADASLGTVVSHALFGDGAGATVVGADPDLTTERPIFEMVSSSQATVSGTEHFVTGYIGKAGLHFSLSSELPSLVASNIEHCLVDAFRPLGHVSGGGWNSLFMAMHPGGRAILDGIEAALELGPEKLAASRRVLRDYGNMSGASVIFVLDEIRRRGDGEEWGVLIGFGPGMTVETMVLRACDRPKH
uniref:Uncharacterized protein n=1 Tax=Avena sativa TaxID=4498 RepID=A0ACD6AE28_AVESA